MLQEYLLPTTVDSALIMLKDHGGRARLIAGGTDLILQEEKAEKKAQILVDISRIQDLQKIEKKSDALFIGACVTHTEIASSPLIQKHAPALAFACSCVGGKQIRNIATLGGNIVTAQPAADGAIACAGLNATCLIRGTDGSTQEKTLPQLYAGVAKSTIDSSSQMLTHIKIPLSKKSEGSNYQRMEQRKALALPMLSVVAKVVIENNLITEASIVYGPVSPGPKHAEEAEKFLCGKKAEDKNFLEAGKIASQHATFRSSPVRGSQEFRSQVFPVCITRALREASKIATGKKA